MVVERVQKRMKSLISTVVNFGATRSKWKAMKNGGLDAAEGLYRRRRPGTGAPCQVESRSPRARVAPFGGDIHRIALTGGVSSLPLAGQNSNRLCMTANLLGCRI